MQPEKQTDYQRRIIALSAKFKTFIGKKVGNHHDMDDLHQNTLMKLCENEKKFDPGKGTLEAFTFTICEREIINFFRANGHSMLIFSDNIAAYGTACEDTMCARIDSEDLLRLLDDEKRIAFLKYHSGKTKRTSTERNKAMRTLRELRRKVARFEREGFSE